MDYDFRKKGDELKPWLVLGGGYGPYVDIEKTAKDEYYRYEDLLLECDSFAQAKTFAIERLRDGISEHRERLKEIKSLRKNNFK